ncbi:MAG: AAA family ATPase [Halobacteriota archaeon]|nr:AAA family ATPase [Halobacteriota archaeon]
MGKVIAVSGKGGTGKTNVSALLINYLVKKNAGSILAIDGDPDSNLPEVLGEEVNKTVGDVREDLLKERDTYSKATDKQLLLEYKVMGILHEGEKLDILAMGRPEGPGCYCSLNHQLRAVIDTLSKNYDFCVVDAEAGLEHMSRRTLRDVNTMLIVTDASRKGLDTAGRIKKLAKDLEIKFSEVYVIANRVKDEDKDKIAKNAEEMGLEIIGTAPFDQTVADFDLEGRPLTQLPEDSPFLIAVEEIAAKIGL